MMRGRLLPLIFFILRMPRRVVPRTSEFYPFIKEYNIKINIFYIASEYDAIKDVDREDVDYD